MGRGAKELNIRGVDASLQQSIVSLEAARGYLSPPGPTRGQSGLIAEDSLEDTHATLVPHSQTHTQAYSLSIQAAVLYMLE